MNVPPCARSPFLLEKGLIWLLDSSDCSRFLIILSWGISMTKEGCLRVWVLPRSTWNKPSVSLGSPRKLQNKCRI